MEQTQQKINELQVNIQLGVNSSDLVEFRLGRKINIQEEKGFEYSLLDTETRQSILKVLVDKIFVDPSGSVRIIYKE